MSNREVEHAYYEANNRTHQLDRDSIQCREEHDQAGMQKCDQQYTPIWDKQLNDNYKLLMGTLGTSGSRILQDSERKWLDFDRADLEMGKFMSTAAGRIFQKEELLRDRTLQLASRFGQDQMPEHVPDLAATEERLNTVYQQVKTLLSPEQQKVLLASQRKWIAFKDSEYELIDRLYPQPENGGINVENTVAKSKLLDDRNKELRLLAANIERRN